MPPALTMPRPTEHTQTVMHQDVSSTKIEKMTEQLWLTANPNVLSMCHIGTRMREGAPNRNRSADLLKSRWDKESRRARHSLNPREAIPWAFPLRCGANGVLSATERRCPPHRTRHDPDSRHLASLGMLRVKNQLAIFGTPISLSLAFTRFCISAAVIFGTVKRPAS